MSASGMGGQLGRQEAREIPPEQAPNAGHEGLDHAHNQSSAGSRGAVDLNLNLAPLPDRPAGHQVGFMYTMPSVQSPNSQGSQLNNLSTAHINYGPPTRIQQGVSNASNVIESIHQDDINRYNQDRLNLQRNLLYYPGALQRGNILSARANPYQVHQTNLEQLQSLQQQQQQQQQNVVTMQSYSSTDMMQYNQQFNPNLSAPGVMEHLMYPSRRIPNHVRQQRMRRRSRANRAHVTHINTVAADMTLGHSDAANITPGTIPESPARANLEYSQSETYTGVRQERRLQGVSIAIAEDTCLSIGENFECNICFQKADEAVVTCCGHLFCWPCLYRWLHVHSSHKECPVCKGAVDHECSITPIYGRENASARARMHCTLGAERIPPRPPARRVESARQSREREEREREREVRDREELEQNVAFNVAQGQPIQDRTNPTESHENLIFEQSAPRNDGGGNNILVQLDQRERSGARSDFRDRNMPNFSIDPGVSDLEQRDDSTRAYTSNRPGEDNYGNMYMDGREGGTMSSANNSREESNVYMTTDQREVRTQNIFHDLPTVEDAQPNLLRGGAPPNAGGVFESSSITATSRAHLLHQRMAQRREQLRAALAASRNNYTSNLIDHAEGRQDVMQAAALLSQEWDDLVDISRVAINPVQAAAWLTTMHARLADMETNSHSFRQQAQNTLAEHSSSLGPALQGLQEHTREATRDQPLATSQTGELLTAMHARFNNIQRIIETLQRPSFALTADPFSSLEPLDVEQPASGGTRSPQESSQLMAQRPSEATALSEGSAPELSNNGQDGADLIRHGESATQQLSVPGSDNISFRRSGDYPSLDNSGVAGTTLPLLALIEQRRGSGSDGSDESGLPLRERQNEGNIREQRGSGAGDIVLEMNPTPESPAALQASEWPTSTRTRSTTEDDDEGDHRDRSGDETDNTVNIATGAVESVAGTRDRKRRRMTDTV